jgi:hypothetical protein
VNRATSAPRVAVSAAHRAFDRSERIQRARMAPNTPNITATAANPAPPAPESQRPATIATPIAGMTSNP